MRNQRGNILFLILLAVILFAALSYAVTSSMRGGGKDGADEKLDLLASQIIQTGTMVENTFARAKLSSGMPDWGYDIDDGPGPVYGTANATCQKQSCRIFTTNARPGMMEPISLPKSIMDPDSLESGVVVEFGTFPVKNIGTNLPEVIMLINDLKPELCRAINKKLWGQAVNPHQALGVGGYAGTLTALPDQGNANYIGMSDDFYANKPMGCLGRESSSPSIGGFYYHVLIAR